MEPFGGRGAGREWVGVTSGMQPKLHHRTAKLINKIDVSAFAGIMFVLLFIMMAPVRYEHPRGMDVDLAHVLHPVSMPGANREDAMRVAVMRDGRVFFGSERIDPSFLDVKIEERLQDKSVERNVYILADRRARWGAVKPVLDGVRSAGILRVTFVALEDKRPPLH